MKCRISIIIIFLITIKFNHLFEFCACEHFNSFNDNVMSLYCGDHNKSQNTISIPEIMGMWYGNEIITHQDDYDNRTGTFYYDTCVVIHLADVTDQMRTTTNSPRRIEYHHNYATNMHDSQIRYLRLIWDETNANVEYILRYNNSRRGFWIASAPQTGSILDLDIPYRQFYGTIQVMKAVGDHIVLTFCKNMPESQQYSIILSRRPNSLSQEDLRGIRENILRRRKLQILSIRKVCTSNANGKSLTSLLIILSFIICFKKMI